MRHNRSHSSRSAFAAAVVAIGLAFAWLNVGAMSDAFAKPKSKSSRSKSAKAIKSAKPAKPTEAQQKALADFLGPYKFGMTKDEILAVLRAQLDARFKAEFEASQDVYRQDRIRATKKLEVERLGNSYTEFDGKKTGWDVSIVDGEFVHNNNESLLEYWENSGGKNQRRFFFFHNGKLFKMVIALDARQVDKTQRTFDFFVGLMESRLGTAVRTGSEVAWKLSAAHVSATDELEFYNAFCLAFVDAARMAEVKAARTAMGTKPKQENRLIKSITAADDDDGPSLDAGKDAIDKVIKRN